MAKSTPTQREPLRLLSYGQSVSTPIAVVAVSGLTISVVSLLLQILNYGATSRLAHKDPPSLVQLADGNVITVAPLGPRDRTPETIKKFTSDVLVTMFNWDGVLNSSTTTTPVPDPGIPIKLERKPGKVTTSAWESYLCGSFLKRELPSRSWVQYQSLSQYLFDLSLGRNTHHFLHVKHLWFQYAKFYKLEV